MKFMKWQSLLVVMIVLAGILSACGSSNQGNEKKPAENNGNKQATEQDSGKKVTISVATNVVGEQAKVLQAIADNFMKENPTIKVDFSAPGKDYENMMKIKMASNDLPDVFSTHGWAKLRYGQYLADLKDEAWVATLDEAIKPAVTDDAGKVYVLPMDQDKSGIVYNKDVLEKYNIAIPQTYAQLMEAAETITKESGGAVAPFHMGGSDNWPVGQYFDYFANPLYISAAQNQSAQLLDGSFDWSNWDQFAEMFADLHKKGYLNKDVLTAKYNDDAKALAEGKTAFLFYGAYAIEEAKKINPELHAGFMPIPSIVEGDTPTFVGGEKTTWGVSKDSKNIEAAKKFVAYFAKPENAQLVAVSNALPSGIKGTAVDAGDLSTYYEQYKDIRVLPYFDRVFLPNGMWDVMCKNGQDLISGGITVKQFSENMEKEYNRLRAAAVK
ncbi:ABC transporter substrate-binding protein [Paenibacillus radicis (ex Gao et al. 2016)]|uniref:Binding protein MsmE n=1 Tax=Paenibacillus radicis (ex Gao et al. 2016) TaxID=1737354 RepID=A0A917GX63_9BACL|nr:extracellular solute-binding protein [Paenibacillus radicis (ex Gao et al. 2016)]GGG59573.1 putative binding protein MsmE [Paenibacillus radicis (ex Gao et al. 2016)]